MAWTKEKAREYAKELLQWCHENHYCVQCHKAKAVPGKKCCYECAEKARLRNLSRTPEVREKMNEAARRKYHELKEAGICVKCRKRAADKGKSFCGICRGVIRIQSINKSREEGRLPMQMRGDGYHCAICGKEPEKIGDKLCVACYQRNLKNVENARSYAGKENRKWDRDIERECNEKKRTDGDCRTVRSGTGG